MGNGAVSDQRQSPRRARRETSASSRRSMTPSRRPTRAFRAFRTRPLDDRRKAVECIRKICVEPGRRARAGSSSKRPRSAGSTTRSPSSATRFPQVPGVEYLRTDNVSGDDGLTLTDYAPFGVIGAITPVTHSLPTLAGNAINMLAAGNTVVFNAHPSGHADRGRRRAPVQQGDPRGDRARKPADDHRPAHARIGRGPVRPQGRAAAGRHRRARPSRGPPWPARSGRSSPGRAIRRSSSTRPPASRTRPGRSSPAARSTTTCSASARSRSSPSPRSSTR